MKIPRPLSIFPIFSILASCLVLAAGTAVAQVSLAPPAAQPPPASKPAAKPKPKPHAIARPAATPKQPAAAPAATVNPAPAPDDPNINLSFGT